MLESLVRDEGVLQLLVRLKVVMLKISVVYASEQNCDLLEGFNLHGAFSGLDERCFTVLFMKILNTTLNAVYKNSYSM